MTTSLGVHRLSIWNVSEFADSGLPIEASYSLTRAPQIETHGSTLECIPAQLLETIPAQ